MLGGELVHQTADEHGSIQVVDYMENIRALHFDNKTQQSACLLCNPNFLIHKYAQAMTLPLCWLQPKRILILGLGAGSIVKFMYHYHPETMIDAVELRPKVTEIASKYFMLPAEDERLHITHCSAHDWFQRPLVNKYDIIIADVFLTTRTGEDITIDISDTLQKLYNQLTDNGIAVFNYLGSNRKLYPGYNRLNSLFEEKLYSIDIESTNSIILASKKHIPVTIEDAVYNKLDSICSLPYKQYFDLLQFS